MSESSTPQDNLAERRRIDAATRDVPDYFNRAVNVVNGWLMDFRQPASAQTAEFVIANCHATAEGERSYSTAHFGETVHFAAVAVQDRDPVAAVGAVANFLGGFINPHTLVPSTYHPAFRNVGMGDPDSDMQAVVRAMTEQVQRRQVEQNLQPLNFPDRQGGGGDTPI